MAQDKRAVMSAEPHSTVQVYSLVNHWRAEEELFGAGGWRDGQEHDLALVFTVIPLRLEYNWWETGRFCDRRPTRINRWSSEANHSRKARIWTCWTLRIPSPVKLQHKEWLAKTTGCSVVSQVQWRYPGNEPLLPWKYQASGSLGPPASSPRFVSGLLERAPFLPWYTHPTTYVTGNRNQQWPPHFPLIPRVTCCFSFIAMHSIRWNGRRCFNLGIMLSWVSIGALMVPLMESNGRNWRWFRTTRCHPRGTSQDVNSFARNAGESAYLFRRPTVESRCSAFSGTDTPANQLSGNVAEFPPLTELHAWGREFDWLDNEWLDMFQHGQKTVDFPVSLAEQGCWFFQMIVVFLRFYITCFSFTEAGGINNGTNRFFLCTFDCVWTSLITCKLLQPMNPKCVHQLAS